MRIAGGWQITETELWDSDDLNLVAPAFIEFADDGSGSGRHDSAGRRRPGDADDPAGVRSGERQTRQYLVTEGCYGSLAMSG